MMIRTYLAFDQPGRSVVPYGYLLESLYEEAATLLAPVRVPEGPLPAGPLTLTADAEWLVCRVECIPESGRLTLELPHPGSPTVGDPATQRLFAAARAQWPEADRVTGRYRLAGDARTLILEVLGLAVDDRAEVWFAGLGRRRAAVRWDRTGQRFGPVSVPTTRRQRSIIDNNLYKIFTNRG